MDKRYQIFVSSTYADLKDERQRVIQALMEMDCIPAGMELFPAVDEEQFAFIKRVIDDCDYYLLVIGGRYGSLTSAGISYTEQEYDYAVAKDLKVIALLHQAPDDIPLGKSERDPELRAKLDKFREKVSTGRLVRFWNSANELPGIVALSLSKTIKTYPARGWIRADRIAKEEVLAEINELRKRNAALSTELAALRTAPAAKVENLAGLDEAIEVSGKHWSQGRSGYLWTARPTWRQIFSIISPYLVRHPAASTVKGVLEKGLFKMSSASGSSPDLEDQVFQTISVQLKALGLVNIQYTKNIAGGMDLFWSATPSGERLTLDLRTVKSAEKNG
ncbi:DUF4062 domain-containing protein [Acidovorax facilis]|uniref:DUF4062 domain-containing protein n=1 Tax=Acidovorax facilis TaxID=12917 RepID=UPI003D65D5AD